MEIFPKYPSIEGLHRQNDILNFPCVITEKLHGTNSRLMWGSESKLLLGSREQIVYKNGEILNKHYGFTEWGLEHLPSKFEQNPEYHNHVFYGEWFGEGIQKGVEYCVGKQFRLFDMRLPNGDLANWEDVVTASQVLNLPHVPVIHEGLFKLDYLESIRDGVSIEAVKNGINKEGNTWEGVVIKPLQMRRDRHGEWMMAKYKSEKWAENCKAPKPKTLDPEKLDRQEKARLFAESVVTPGRAATIKDHLTRNGNDQVSMTRTGEFLRALVEDIQKEHAELFKTLTKDESEAHCKAINNLGILKWKRIVEES